MKKLLHKITSLDRWYDSINEPFRFLFFLLFVVIPISVSMGNLQFMPAKIYFIFVMLWVVYRICMQSFRDFKGEG